MAGLYIITGSNGAGKSSFGASYLPEHLQGYNIFDGDKLFMQKRRQLHRAHTPQNIHAAIPVPACLLPYEKGLMPGKAGGAFA